MAKAAEEMSEVDVIVIGAGISGLCAAHKILKTRSQCKIVVLEAKGRVGGRLDARTLKSANGTDVWDVGGQWIGRTQKDILSLMEEFEVESYPQWYTGSKVLEPSDGHIIRYSSSLPGISYVALLDLYWLNYKLENLAKEVPLDDPSKWDQAEHWDGMTVESWKQQNAWTSAAKELLDIAVGVVFGATPSQMSMLSFLHNIHSAGGWALLIESGLEGSAQEWKIKGSAYHITELLVEKIGKANIMLNHPVTAIKQENNKVFVSTLPGRSFTAKYVVLATPPNESGKIQFCPPLPCNKAHLLQNMPTAHLIKYIASYSTAFWRESGMSGETCHTSGIDQCNTNPVGCTFDATTHEGSPAIVGFIVPPIASKWSGKAETEIKEAILKSLQTYLGPEAAEPLDFALKDWAQEKWNGGCPGNIIVPGALTNYGDCLRDPFLRVHWAGTETSAVWRGYISGAVNAGWRAAQEVLEELQD